ncbi:hypothetical protein ACFY94_15170 [Streptomyces griseorubiginosus]|uniref:hypothetical protein n=1 Tax=Streptomyces griseorubiginosus TaxID=67304 RepID=UPI0036EBEECA
MEGRDERRRGSGNVVDLAVGIVIGAATVGAIAFPYGAFVTAAISFFLLAGAAIHAIVA